MFSKVIAIAALISGAAFAQEDYTRFKNEGAVLGIGSFVKQTTNQGVQQDADHKAGVLASYRFFFNRNSGVEGNYAWIQNTERYGASGIKNNTHEISAAYIFRIPRKHFAPFLLAGVGALVFDPKDFAGANNQTRAAFLYGGGADINLTDHLFVRAQYRGLVYNSPTNDLATLDGLDRITHRAEPTVGFGWRF